MAITTNLSHLAIGLGDGTVLLYRHLLQSLTTSPTALTSLPRARVVHESPEPITGLGFREPTTSSATTTNSRAPENEKTSGQISLLIVTTNRVLVASTSAKGGDARTIDEMGCGLGCAVMDWERREMIVARDEAVYVYGAEGRGACYAYEGEIHHDEFVSCADKQAQRALYPCLDTTLSSPHLHSTRLLDQLRRQCATTSRRPARQTEIQTSRK